MSSLTVKIGKSVFASTSVINEQYAALVPQRPKQRRKKVSRLRWLKQRFCNHKYVFFPYEDIYLSCGDEYDDRKSRLYRGECLRCNHRIEIIKRWTLLEKEKKN